MAETTASSRQLNRLAPKQDQPNIDGQSTKRSKNTLGDLDEAAQGKTIEKAHPASEIQARPPASLSPRDQHEEITDQRKEITDNLDAGTHALILEHNVVISFKAPYRINLQKLDPNNDHVSKYAQRRVHRFFHITCIEAIGLDLANHLQLPDVAIDIFAPFHPAINHWIEFKGKTYDSDVYADFDKACNVYESERQDRASGAGHGASDSTTELKQPQIEDFVPDAEAMVERSLSEVILDLMGGLHLTTAGMYSPNVRVWVLEIWGDVGQNFSLEAHNAKIAGSAEAGQDQELVGETDHGTQALDAGEPSGETGTETGSVTAQARSMVDEGSGEYPEEQHFDLWVDGSR